MQAAENFDHFREIDSLYYRGFGGNFLRVVPPVSEAKVQSDLIFVKSGLNAG